MRLADIDFIRLLPQFMRSDDAIKGLSKGINAIVPGLNSAIGKLTTWDSIDQLTETELDELAWELNILWYNTGANIDIKRDLVKNSDLVYKRLGTKWAIENVIKTYFGEGYIAEWFEYEGSPGHFRVYSSNPSLSNEKLTEFLNLLSKIKRVSAKLDGIYITLTGEMPLCAGTAIHEVSTELYPIGSASDIT
ncbi:MAG: phage tail protein I [Clostridiales bacterium]|nr:phage tail protein I [Clostridiales bacterium]